MANLNKVMLIGNLTRDPEIRTFGNGGKVAAFGFAVNNNKKNQQTGQWESVPVFIDCDAYNRGEYGKTADTIEKYCRKGTQIYLEGHLILDTWNDKTTGKERSKLKLVVDSIQLLDRRQTDGGEGGFSGGEERPARSAPARSATPARSGSGFSKSYDDSDGPSGASSGGNDDEVPF